MTISDNLALWLAPHVRESGPLVYFIESFFKDRKRMDVDTFGKRLQHLVSAKEGDGGRPAIVSPWPDNALRHSFCSYFYGRTKNINLTAAEAGNSPRIVERHYKGLARDSEVQAYWNIRPSGKTAEIIPIGSAA